MDGNGIDEAVAGLLREALEAKSAGVLVYEAALICARDRHLQEEWERHRAQSERHAEVAESLLRALGVDPDEPTPGRLAVRDKGIACVDAILSVVAEAPNSAQVVAAECILDAERKSELSWELLAEVAQRLAHDGPGHLIRVAHAVVAGETHDQAERARRRCRELWLAELGMPQRRYVRSVRRAPRRASA